MPRPHKLKCPTHTFNCLLRQEQYDKLCRLKRRYDVNVSLADMVRIAIDEFLDDRMGGGDETPSL